MQRLVAIAGEKLLFVINSLLEVFRSLHVCVFLIFKRISLIFSFYMHFMIYGMIFNRMVL